jgi:hypothetical protein
MSGFCAADLRSMELAWQTRNVENAFFQLMKDTKDQSGNPLIKDVLMVEKNRDLSMLGC